MEFSDKISYNQELVSRSELKLSYNNRAFRYGDGIFDTLKYENKGIQFLEDHYFRLMSSMRMLRMNIPMYFTLEFYKDEILKTMIANPISESVRIRVSVFRKEGGLYTPKNNDIDMLIESGSLIGNSFSIYEIDLFKDYPIYSGQLSNIKTNNRITNVLASIYISEYELQNCILINEKKNIVEASNANIFLIKDKNVYTPSLDEGCINGIIRKKVIEKLEKSRDYTVFETSISPFELLKADEVFITNSIIGIQSVTNYRKKVYKNTLTEQIEKNVLN